MVSAGAMQGSLLALASITGAGAFFSNPGAGTISWARSTSASAVASTSALGSKRYGKEEGQETNPSVKRRLVVASDSS